MADEKLPFDDDVVVLKEEDKSVAPKETTATAPQSGPNGRLQNLIVRAKSIIRKPWFLALAAAVLLMGIFALLYSLIEPSKEPVYVQPALRPDQAMAPAIDERQLIEENLRTSSLEKLIAKAGLLYAKGDIAQALDIYEEVALFSESLSWYNLGVARMKKNEYAEAMAAFEASLSQKEHRTVAAINAAVCALRLQDEEAFRRFIRTAREHLPDETKAPCTITITRWSTTTPIAPFTP